MSSLMGCSCVMILCILCIQGKLYMLYVVQMPLVEDLLSPPTCIAYITLLIRHNHKAISTHLRPFVKATDLWITLTGRLVCGT